MTNMEINTISSAIQKREDNHNTVENGFPKDAIDLQHKRSISFSETKDGKKSSSATLQPEHEGISHPTTYFETLAHIFKGNIGSGLLAMGDAFKNGGIVFATFMTAIIGVTCVHSQHMLLNCSNKMQNRCGKRDPPDFANTVQLCFVTGPPNIRCLAKYMGFLVNVFLCVTQLGFCCVYIVFIGTNVQKISGEFGWEMDLSLHIMWVMIPIVLSCMVRNLKYLTPFSSIANVVLIVGVGMVVYKAAEDLPPVSSRHYVASLEQLPLYFGTAIYAFEGIGLVLPLKSEMRNPELFQKPLGVLNVGMVIVGSTFITVGFLGYLKWGEDVQGSLTLNLESGNIITNVVQILITLGILLTYPLQFYVPVKISWPALQRKLKNKNSVIWELAYRLSLVTLTFILAEAIPQLGLFISLVGAVSSTALALIFPPIIDSISKIYDKRNFMWYAVIIKNILIGIFGALVFVFGTSLSIKEIVQAFKQ